MRQRGTPRVRPPIARSVVSSDVGVASTSPARRVLAAKRTPVKKTCEVEDALDPPGPQGAEEMGEDSPYPSATSAILMNTKGLALNKSGVDRGSCVSPHERTGFLGPIRAHRAIPNEVCPFSHEDMSCAVDLRCGHRFSLGHLDEARDRAKLCDGSGQALICPLCGDQHRYALEFPSGDLPKAVSIYSSCTDAYLGDLRKDWRQPLRLPRQMQPLIGPPARSAFR